MRAYLGLGSWVQLNLNNHPARELATFKPQAARSYKTEVCKMSPTQPSICLGSDTLRGEKFVRDNPELLGGKGTKSFLS